MWSASEEALLAGLAAGDQDSAVAFIRRFQRQVFGLALAIIGDAGGAEDVAQEAFLRAWRHAQAYDARRGSVAAWLLAITRNLAIDALRMRRAEPIHPERLMSMNLAATDVAPEDAAVASDSATRVRAAIGKLPENHKRALVLAAFYGRSAREISEAESIPLGTAKTRIRDAMLKLRAALVDEETR
ncbi:MAG: RNA polymerase sigma factor [Actinomycetota bacterium]|nr:sigma-70 family RNA polymerase sigma factor [Actinomycetota bacterium]